MCQLMISAKHSFDRDEEYFDKLLLLLLLFAILSLKFFFSIFLLFNYPFNYQNSAIRNFFLK